MPALQHPERYCAKCFKDNPQPHFIDERKIHLCRGCAFELKTWQNFLRAYGLVVSILGDRPSEGLEGVVKGEQVPSNNGKEAISRP